MLFVRKRSANVASTTGFYLRESEAAAATTTRGWSLSHFCRMCLSSSCQQMFGHQLGSSPKVVGDIC
ncbi:hypothetical protein [Lysinibacillus xylanilyticus]|uniref:hypothetical protein n=1 Tax=Lysinibacillus xylanilyticus TaxID=582475 RepID=UPI003D07167B